MSAQAREDIARKHGIALMLEFGSAMTGRLHPRSDLDLAVLLRQARISLQEQADLTPDVQGLFPGREVDVNYHLITEAGPPPADYDESLTHLTGLGVLDRDFATRRATCPGLRNRIVHEYDEIDPARVHEALQVAAKDIPAYVRAVEAYVARAGS